MRIRGIGLLAVVATGVLIVTSAIEAQLPHDTMYVASSNGEKAGNALVAFNKAGTLTSIVPLTLGASPASLTMGARNEEILIWDRTLVHKYHVLGGVVNLTTLLGTGIRCGDLDEDGGMIWASNSGSVYKSDTTSCTQIITVTTMPGYTFDAVCLNGTTGDYLLAGKDSKNTTWDLFFMDVNGYVFQTLTGLPGITGLDWSPWSGDVYATFNTGSGGVLRITQEGRVSTLNMASTPSMASPGSLEVREQPTEILLCTEAGTSPQHLTFLTTGGHVTSLHTSSGKFHPADAEFMCNRQVWALGSWNVGKIGFLSVNFGAQQAGKFYQVALAWGHTPGIPVKNVGTIHLALDNLFYSSILLGPPVFQDFTGVLDARGKASPYVNIPYVNELIGVHAYGAAVAFDNPGGITAISNCWPFTFGWT